MGAVAGTVRRAKFILDRHTKLKSFRKQCRAPMEAQWNFLKRLLHRHKDTDFGRQFDFGSIDSIAEYKKRVPLHTWEDVAPYIEKVQQGEITALFPPNEKLIMYAATSGTTGNPKYIPVTQTSYKLYGKYWDHFWAFVSEHAPECTAGKALYFPGDPEEGTVNGVPFGAITAKAYGQQNPIIREMYPYPYQICRIKDYQIRYYTIMRFGVESNITIIPIANPSTILTLFKLAQDRAKDIIEDIRTGRLRYANRMPADVRALLLRKIKPNPRRADQLEAIFRHTRKFRPVEYWGSHPLAITCFASGPLRLYMKQLRHYHPDLRIADFGLLASEGRLSLGVGTIRDSKGCCPTLESNFFEFIPEFEIDSENPETLTLDQLELGKRYFIIFSNYSGLYRYNISDLIQVTDFLENTPLFTFCNKGKHMSSITGEKLSEYQITESVRLAGDRVGYKLEEFVVCLHWDEAVPSYTLLKDGLNQDSPSLLQRFINCVDEELMKLNLEYKSKRASLRLGPLSLKQVRHHGYRLYEKKKQEAAHNISQYKPAFLISTPKFEDQFEFDDEITSTANPASA